MSDRRGILKTRDNTGLYCDAREAVLQCGHTTRGAPTIAVPARWWCSTCRTFQPERRRRAAA